MSTQLLITICKHAIVGSDLARCPVEGSWDVGPQSQLFVFFAEYFGRVFYTFCCFRSGIDYT